MRVLIIEDEYKLANALKSALEAERHVVDLCYAGEEGYEQATIEEYDVIILDLGLPDMDGLEVCGKIRQEKITTPILILTARDTLNDKVKGLDQGADDYLIKPFEFDELLARIRALLRRGDNKSGTILEVDTLTLDPTKRLVHRDGQTIELSAKEYALLEFFMRHPDQIVSKTTLLDHVWGSEVDPFSNVVDVYVGYLRRKINKPFPGQTPLIHTVKGMGYRLRQP